MGLTIYSKNCAADCGYGGFGALRQKVADLADPEIGSFYRELDDGQKLFGDARTAFFEKYDQKLCDMSEQYGKTDRKKQRILDFLYQSDCEGKVGILACRAIWEVIKDYDDDFRYGYAGRPDCMMFSDFKDIVQDCIKTKTPLRWD